jgi:uncharacterized protein (DUF1501 family)
VKRNWPTLSRRRFGIGALGATLAALSTGASSTTRHRFLFVHAEGGWDPLCAFAPLFDAPQIDMEPMAELRTIGNFHIVDGPGRPSVPAFFERWGDQTLLINGLSTRSVNHETCQTIALTGATSDAGTDWATLIAAAEGEKYYLPHLVLAGPAFPGKHTIYVSRAEGLVQEAVHGSLLDVVDAPLVAPSEMGRKAVDDYLAARAGRFAEANKQLAMSETYRTALDRSRSLTEARDAIHFTEAMDLRSHAGNAIQLLADGVARCATVSTGPFWDTHTNNADQTPLFEQLFLDLDWILERLGSTQLAEGGSLADETTVVVLSEMGRTPAYNGTFGRDHWPYTSALVIGPGITGNRTIGGYTDLYAGIGADPATGELDPDRSGVDAKSLGATLLTLGGLDPAQLLNNAEVLEGVLS